MSYLSKENNAGERVGNNKVEKELQQRSLSILDKATELQVTNAKQYCDAAMFLTGIKTAKDNVAGFFDPLIKKAYDSWKSLCVARKKYEDPLDDGERLTKLNMLDWIENPGGEEVPKLKEINLRSNFAFRIKDESLLPREFTMPDRDKIGKIVKSLRDMTDIPGVEVYPVKSIAVMGDK